MKTCRTCKETKPVEQFYLHHTASDGYNGDCKECVKTVARERARRIAPDRKPVVSPVKRAILAELAKGPRTIREIAYEHDLDDDVIERSMAHNARNGLVVQDGDLFSLAIPACLTGAEG